MILDPKSTTVAYRCPVCGNGVLSMVGILALSADMMRLKCSCKKSAMTLKYERGNLSGGEKTIKVTVPCLFCPNDHVFNVKPSVFFSRDLFVLPCPLTGFDIFFCGTQKDVADRLDQVRDELIELTGNKDVFSVPGDEYAGDEDENDEVDPHIVEIVRYGLIDMLDAGDVKCHCPPDSDDGDTGGSRYSLSFDTDGSTVYAMVKCNRCGASRVIQITGINSAMKLLESDGITLD